MEKQRYFVARLLEGMIGRRRLVRSARFLLNYARRDLPNVLGKNGEWMVQDSVLSAAEGDSLIVFDVGANVGAWSKRLLVATENWDQGHVVIHAFEPSEATYGRLVSELLPQYEGRLIPRCFALSNHAGEAPFYEVHQFAGTNSLHPTAELGKRRESVVPVQRIDEYCAASGVEEITLLKVDTEGHDFCVLEGAAHFFDSQAIGVVQFEYNHRWMGPRRFLKDVFEFLGPRGYTIGKVTPSGVEWYEGWSADLETLIEGNYVAALPRWKPCFPDVPWWNQGPPVID